MSDYRNTIENNPVLKKMYELASLRFGKDRVVIRHVVPRVVDKQCAWDLFEHPSDAAPVETVVVVDANLSRKMQIDDEVSIDLEQTRANESSG